MEFKEPFVCDSCDFKITQLISNYKFNRQAMVKRVCDFQSDRCFYEFIDWIKNNFHTQPERSKREDLERGCGALNTADNVVRDK
ncbi:MAG: hypothetical protein ACHQVS_00515 [Candidatus Babeliales bacterium]